MPRRFQFSLKTLLVIVLVLGAFLGGRSVGRRAYEIEHAADLKQLRTEWIDVAKLHEQLHQQERRLEPLRDFSKERKIRVGGNGEWVEFAGVRVQALDGKKLQVQDSAPTSDD